MPNPPEKDLVCAVEWLKRLSTPELYKDRLGALTKVIDELMKARELSAELSVELDKCKKELDFVQKERDSFKKMFLDSY